MANIYTHVVPEHVREYLRMHVNNDLYQAWIEVDGLMQDGYKDRAIPVAEWLQQIANEERRGEL